MLSSIVYSLCANCGGGCGFGDILCKNCRALIKKVDSRCLNCGHPLRINASYCGYCGDIERWIDHYYSDYWFDGAARKMILEVKYNWRIRGYSQIGRICECFGVDFNAYDLACIVPSHILRVFMRYIHPVNVIKKALSPKIRFENLLKRTRYTKYQSRLSKRERRLNIKGVFKTDADLNKKKIILIDDIMTTGSTLSEAAKTLKSAGAEIVDVYTLFARSPA
jgi:predicted amidophosphoribosyltransferase